MNSFLLFGFSTCPSFLAEVRLFVFEKFLPVIFLFWTTGIRITSFCTTRFIFFSWFSTFCRSIFRFSILILIAWCTFVTFAAESFTSLTLIRTAFASFSAFFTGYFNNDLTSVPFSFVQRFNYIGRFLLGYFKERIVLQQVNASQFNAPSCIAVQQSDKITWKEAVRFTQIDK